MLYGSHSTSMYVIALNNFVELLTGLSPSLYMEVPRISKGKLLAHD